MSKTALEILKGDKGGSATVGSDVDKTPGGETSGGEAEKSGGGTTPNREILDKAKEGSGKDNGGAGKVSRKRKSKGVQADLPAHLFKGKNWQGVASLPFNVRKAMTGSDVFNLDDDQKEILGDGLGAVMQALGAIDPKYLALTVFSVNLLSIWGEKEAIYALGNRKEKTS